MKDHIKSYKEKLGKTMCEYMDMPATERSAGAIAAMAECWHKLEKLEKKMCYPADLTADDIAHWNKSMVNDDGTTGGHWTVPQTTAVAESVGVKFDHISEWCWNAAMNMMYSDYCEVANRHGVGTAEFYADMAKAFLFDKDGGAPKHKLAAYYHGIVEK